MRLFVVLAAFFVGSFALEFEGMSRLHEQNKIE